MKYYGLIDVQGEGDDRKVKVSEIARRILTDPREDDSEKRQLIKLVALMPSAHKALYKEYPTGLASDGSVLHFLHTQGFNQEAANDLLAEYKQTASQVNLYEPSNSVDKKIVSDDTLGPEQERKPEVHHLQAQPLTTAPPELGRPTLTQGRRAVFDLSEGEVVITFPDKLSPESVSDLQDYINVFMKKAQREALLQ